MHAQIFDIALWYIVIIKFHWRTGFSPCGKRYMCGFCFIDFDPPIFRPILNLHQALLKQVCCCHWVFMCRKYSRIVSECSNGLRLLEGGHWYISDTGLEPKHFLGGPRRKFYLDLVLHHLV